MLHRYNGNVLRAVSDTPWFVNNEDIYSEADLSAVSETIAQFASIIDSWAINYYYN